MAARLAETEERERQFLMSVSHELRTPLTAISGPRRRASGRASIDDPELSARPRSTSSPPRSVRLERLVGDVLDLAKLNAHRFTVLHEEVDMGRLVEQAYSAFGEEARRREIDYELTPPTSAPMIVSDGDRVLQVITNLLSNAFRWTPDGGRIELGLEAANGAVRSTWPTRDRESRPSSGTGSSGRSSRGTAAGRASACRSRASSRSRSAADRARHGARARQSLPAGASGRVSGLVRR